MLHVVIQLTMTNHMRNNILNTNVQFPLSYLDLYFFLRTRQIHIQEIVKNYK
jgi:hypothetical protein